MMVSKLRECNPLSISYSLLDVSARTRSIFHKSAVWCVCAVLFRLDCMFGTVYRRC